jgi:uncharacterized protein
MCKGTNMMKKILIVLFFLGISVFGASFDCVKASSHVEKMICADVKLSLLDENLSQVFKKAINATDDQDQLKKEQFAWMKERNKCQDISCVQSLYSSKIQTLTKNVQTSKSDLSATSYLSLADKFVKQYDETKQTKNLIGADHYYKLYIHGTGNGTVEKRATNFVNKYKIKLSNLTFPNQTVVTNDENQECSYILENVSQFKYINPNFDLSSEKSDESPYLAYKKKCPKLFPTGHGPSTEESRDYQRIYSIDLDKDGKNETIMQINRYSFNPPMSIKTIFDFYIADFKTCKKEQIVSRYYGDVGLNYEGFAQINGDIYYYEKNSQDDDQNLSLPSELVKITNTKFPIGYIEKTHKYSKNGEWCSFTSLQKKYQSCWNYEFSDSQNPENKNYIDECKNLYEKILKK